MLQRTARSGCELAAQVPTHARRADETEKANAPIGRDSLGERVGVS
jgi:hypothetical protein